MNYRLRLSSLSILALTIAGSAQSHTVVRVSQPDAVRPAEVSIAINPKNPANIIAASIQGGRPGGPRAGNHIYLTTDGGKTWKTAAAHNPRTLVQGDDAVTFSSRGISFHSYISFEGIRVARPSRAFTGIFVRSSADGGNTWSDPAPVVDHVNSVTPFEDKPYLRVDNVPNSRYTNNLYIAWTRFDEYGSRDPRCLTHMYFSRSTDDGRSFSVPIRFSDTSGDCLDSDNTVEGAVPAVGIKGEVYLVWAGPKGLSFDRSLDGGVTFGTDRVIAETPGGWDIPIEGISRHNGMPVTGVDHSSGPNRGTIYVNWIDERNGDPDVFLIHSRDGGNTWSLPARVNDDRVGNGKAQFFTWMAVDPVDGSINIVFFDRRDHQGTLTGVTVARSVDGGKTFVNHRINQPPFPCNAAVFFGDYIGIDAYGGTVAAAYNHFTSDRELALSLASFTFKPGTQQQAP